jgi:hypothetical protein
MFENARRLGGLTVSHVKAALAAGTTSTYSTTNITKCCIGGKWATDLAAQTNTASPTTDINTGVAFNAIGVNQGSVFLWGVNAAGAVKVCQGQVVNTQPGVTTTAGAFNEAPSFPVPPDDFCPIGYTVVRVAPSGSSWTFGSSNWTATGVTTAFVDVISVPDRPQIA